MKKTLLLTESQLISLIKIIKEDIYNWVSTSTYPIDGGNDKNIEKLSGRLKKYNITKEEILNLLNQGHTIQEIPNMIGVPYDTLRRRCIEYGIKDKCVGKQGLPQLYNITKEEILNLLNQGHNLVRISDITKIPYQVLNRRCKEYNITDKCIGSSYRRPKKHDISKEKLLELLDQNNDLYKISDITKIPYGTLRRKCIEYGIKDKCVGNKVFPQLYNITKDQILNLLNQNKSLTEISKITNIPYQVLHKRCKEYGISDMCVGTRGRNVNYDIPNNVIINLLKQGKNLKLISDTVSVPEQVLRRKIKNIVDLNLIKMEDLDKFDPRLKNQIYKIIIDTSSNI